MQSSGRAVFSGTCFRTGGDQCRYEIRITGGCQCGQTEQRARGGVSGALLALGAICGYDAPRDQEAKKAHYKLVQTFAGRFKEKNGTIICRELLKNVPVTPGGVPEERTKEYYSRRPCPLLVRDAAAILDEMLSEMRQQESSEN